MRFVFRTAVGQQHKTQVDKLWETEVVTSNHSLLQRVGMQWEGNGTHSWDVKDKRKRDADQQISANEGRESTTIE